MIHLNVARKGAIFIFVPLMISCLIVALLVSELMASEHELQRQFRAREIVSTCDSLSRCIDEASASATQYALTNRPTYLDSYTSSVSRAQQELKKLSDTQKLEPAQKETISSVISTVKQGLSLLDELHGSLQSTGEARAEILSGHMVARLNAIKNGIETKLDQLRTLERQREEKSKNEHDQTIQLLKLSVLVGVILSIFIAIALSMYFGRTITAKLNVMRENTLRFARGDDPHKELGGDDELAELDRAFHTLNSIIIDAQQKERALVNNSSEIICAIEKHGAFSEIGPVVYETWGYEYEEMIGRKLVEIIDEPERERVWKFLESCTTADTAQKLETQVVDKKGDKRDVLFSCQWSKNRSSWYCVASDISDRKQLERMKKDFVAMISHDLRAPLSSIRMTLEMVAGGMYGSLNPGGKEKIERTDSSIVRLLDLLDQLLEVEKMEAGKVELELSFESVDDIVDNAVREVAALAEGKKISTVVVPGEARAFVDRDRLIRVVVNLLSNAIKYSPNGGTIEAHVLDLEDAFEVQVSDQGIGIPLEYQAAIFERYEQIKEKSHRLKGGTGLGLAICKMIVEAHAGEIGVSSEGAGGSTFWFRIPKSVEEVVED